MARPRGSLNNKGIEKRLLSDAKSKSGVILASAIEEAINGNTQAQKLILDKILPTLKTEPRRVEFTLGNGTTAELAGDILKACSNGQIHFEMASNLIGSLSNILKIKEAEQLEERLAKLEAELGGNHHAK